jgi:hypothetical protein
MKKLFCLFIVILLFFSFGCANQSAYVAYAQAMITANAYKRPPGLVQEFDDAGKLVRQTITMPDEGVQIAQIKDSEYAGAIGTFLNTLGMGSVMGYVVKETMDFARTAKPNTNNYNVGGNMGGNTAGENMAGRDLSTSSTSTSTVSTATTSTVSD